MFTTVVMLALLVSIVPASIASDGVVENGTLTITVIDAETSTPIEGVELFLRPMVDRWFDFDMWVPEIIWEEFMDMTDANGTAVFELPPGMYYLDAYKEWYFGKGMEVDMAEGTNITLEMRLEAMPDPSSILSGYVTNVDSGDGIEGAFVHLMPVTPPRMWFLDGWYDDVPEFIYPLMTETDVNGYYEIGVEPSMYMVNVDMEGYYHSECQVDIGDDVSIMLNLTMEAWPEPTSSVSGHVYDFDTGLPMENVTVFAFPLPFYEDMNLFGFGGLGMLTKSTEPEQPMWRTFEAVTDENGSYSTMVSKGRYELLVETEGYLPTFNNIQVPDSVDMTVDISLRPIPVPEYDAYISGYVLDEEGNAIEDAEVSILPSFGLRKERDIFNYEGEPEPTDPYMMDEGGFGFGILDGLLGMVSSDDGFAVGENIDIGFMEESMGYLEDPFMDDIWMDEVWMGDMPIFDEVVTSQPLGLFDALTFTDENGSYGMDAFTGTYFVTVWADGYRTFHRDGELLDIRDNHQRPERRADAFRAIPDIPPTWCPSRRNGHRRNGNGQIGHGRNFHGRNRHSRNSHFPH
jgi:hypothetical protein